MKLTCLSCGQVNRVPDERLSSGPKCATCGDALLPKLPVEVDSATLARAVRNDGLPLVVDFWAPWCGPCRMMAPEFEKAAGVLHGRMRLVKLNTEADPQGGARHAIRSIPTMVKFAGGREEKRQSGAVAVGQIITWAG